MPGAADSIQRLVHAVEAGGAAVWVRRGLAVLVSLASLSIISFTNSKASRPRRRWTRRKSAAKSRVVMAGAQTLIRPRAIGQLQSHGKDVTQKIWYDTLQCAAAAFDRCDRAAAGEVAIGR